MAINCEDNKVELPCDCLPAPPPTPRPIAIAWLNGEFSREGSVAISNNTPASKVQANGAGGLQVIGAITPFGRYVNTPTITFSAPGGAGVTATGTVTLNSNREVSAINITSAGSGYTPFNYYGWTISQEPLASSVTLIADLKNSYFNGSFNPVNRVSTLSPPAGWSPVTVTSLKCVFKISGAFRRDSVGSVRMRYKLNGVTQGAFLQVYQDTENKLVNFTHISKEIVCNSTDIITYEIYTNDGAHIDYIGPVVGLFIPKLN